MHYSKAYRGYFFMSGIRTLEYFVNAEGVMPNTIQNGGQQYEDNATEVVFNIDALYDDKITTDSPGQSILYRIDFNSAKGGYDPSANLSPKSLKRAIPYKFTCNGDNMTATLVVTSVDSNNKNTRTVLTQPVTIAFESVKRNEISEEHVERSFSALEEQLRKDLEEGRLDGKSGVYVGSGDMPPGYNIQIDPRGMTAGEAVVRKMVREYYYPIGSCYCHSNDTDASSIWGGTWELIDKGFKNEYVKYDDAILSGIFTVPENTATTTGVNLHCSRSGSTVRLRIGITSTETFTDTEKVLGSIDFAKLGFTAMPMGYYYELAKSDTANGALMVDIKWDTGMMTVTDVLNGASITSTAPYYIDITFTVTPDKMLDAFCDKFYWKRTG